MPDRSEIALVAASKSYGSTRALINVTVELHRGEVAAFLGENGAGKSTAAKILCGLERPDTGAVIIDGQPADLSGPREAHKRGIFLIPQELSYAPDLTVAENVLLGRTPSRMGLTRPTVILKAAQHHADRFGFDVPLRRRMADIALADRQMVEILKALRLDARAIVLDEPTSALTEDESARLFRAIRVLASSGTSIAFVSHRLDEVLEGSDSIHVFRDGRIVTTLATSTASRQSLLTAMLGRPLVTADRPWQADEQGIPIGLAVSDWSTADAVLAPTTLSFAAGEVSVLYGLRGSGSDALAESLVGARPSRSGRLSVGGRTLRHSVNPRATLRAGIAYVPPDRHRQGLQMQMSVAENLVIHTRNRTAAFGIRQVRRETKLAESAVRRYGIRAASLHQPIAELSGGNQQKVLLASRLSTSPRVLVTQEPSRGVDVGAREEIHQALREFARGGGTVVVSTSDYEEALQLADRITVFRHGRVVGDLRGTAMPEVLNLAKGTEW